MAATKEVRAAVYKAADKATETHKQANVVANGLRAKTDELIKAIEGLPLGIEQRYELIKKARAYQDALTQALQHLVNVHDGLYATIDERVPADGTRKL